VELEDYYPPFDAWFSARAYPSSAGLTLYFLNISRSKEQGGEIPAVALTAYAGEVNQQQAIAAGFQKRLSKPVDPEELVKAIASLYTEH
jgi:CheY-like chemotaxis protein